VAQRPQSGGKNAGAEPGWTLRGVLSAENETTQIHVAGYVPGSEKNRTGAPRHKNDFRCADNSRATPTATTPVISADGRSSRFSSAATNLLEGAPSGAKCICGTPVQEQVLLCKVATSLVSTDPGGALTASRAYSLDQFFGALHRISGGDTEPRCGQGKIAGCPAASPNRVCARCSCGYLPGCNELHAGRTTRISLSPGRVTPAKLEQSRSGPALSGLAKQVALADRKSATWFTPTVPVDDQVFLAVAAGSQTIKKRGAGGLRRCAPCGLHLLVILSQQTLSQVTVAGFS